MVQFPIGLWYAPKGGVEETISIAESLYVQMLSSGGLDQDEELYLADRAAVQKNSIPIVNITMRELMALSEVVGIRKKFSISEGVAIGERLDIEHVSIIRHITFREAISLSEAVSCTPPAPTLILWTDQSWCDGGFPVYSAYVEWSNGDPLAQTEIYFNDVLEFVAPAGSTNTTTDFSTPGSKTVRLKHLRDGARSAYSNGITHVVVNPCL